MHVYLAFLLSLASVPRALEYVEGHVPWEGLVVFLNTLGRSGVVDAHSITVLFCTWERKWRTIGLGCMNL